MSGIMATSRTGHQTWRLCHPVGCKNKGNYISNQWGTAGEMMSNCGIHLWWSCGCQQVTDCAKLDVVFDL